MFTKRRILLGTLALIVVAEVILRVFYYEKLKTRVYPLVYRPDPMYGYSYVPNAESEIVCPSISKKIKINNQGYCGPDFSVEKKPGVKRVAVVGSSEACGLWLNSDSCYARMLQDLFQKNGHNVEVLNFSVDGNFRGLFNLRLISNKVLTYKPDVVLFENEIPLVHGTYKRSVYKDMVLIYSSDDRNGEEKCRARADELLSGYSFFMGCYKLSYIVRAVSRLIILKTHSALSTDLKNLVERKCEMPDIRYKVMPLEGTIAMLKRTMLLVQEDGVSFKVIPYEQDPVMEDLFKNQKIDAIHLNVPESDSLRHRYDSHFNEKGHRLIANRLYQALLRDSVLMCPPEKLASK